MELLLRPFFPGKQILIMDWANDIVYLSMFIFGYVFASNCELQKRINCLIKVSMCLVILCISIFTYIYYMWIVHASKAIYLILIWAFVKGIYECSAIILLLVIGKKYLNKKSFVLNYLNKASFTYYLMHLLPVTVFTFLLVKMDLNIYLKYLLLITLSYVFVFIIYELIVRRLFSLFRTK